MTALAAVIVAFLSASQDIVIDAYRIELLRPEEQGAGAAATQWGYRFGMLAAGAGALYAASFGGWRFAYGLMAALMLVGMVTVWFTPEPGGIRPPRRCPATRVGAGRGLARARRRRALRRYAPSAAGALARSCVFIVLYKFGDALAGSMSNPLYVVARLHQGRGRQHRARSMVSSRPSPGWRSAASWCCGSGMFRALLDLRRAADAVEPDVCRCRSGPGTMCAMLALTIGAENLTGGMASAAFVAYLSGLCNLAFTATQYALLRRWRRSGARLLSASGGCSPTARLDPVLRPRTAACLPGLVAARLDHAARGGLAPNRGRALTEWPFVGNAGATRTGFFVAQFVWSPRR